MMELILDRPQDQPPEIKSLRLDDGQFADPTTLQNSTPTPDWGNGLPMLIIFLVSQILGRDSFSTLAMHQVCRHWHAALGPIYQPRVWCSRSVIFGARVEFIAWALDCLWLDPAGALTLACRRGDVRFLAALKKRYAHVTRVQQLYGVKVYHALLDGYERRFHGLEPLPREELHAVEKALKDATERSQKSLTTASAAGAAAGPQRQQPAQPQQPLQQQQQQQAPEQQAPHVQQNLPQLAQRQQLPAQPIDNVFFPAAVTMGKRLVATNNLVTKGSRMWLALTGRLDEALHAACDAGHLHVIKFLHSELGLTLEHVRSRQCFAVRTLVFHGHIEAVKYLFDEVGVTADDLRARQNYALRIACDNGNLPMVRLLIEHGGLTVEDLRANECEALCAVCVKGHVDVLNYLVAERKMVSREDLQARDFYPMRSACWRGCLTTLKLLVQAGLTKDDLAKDHFAFQMAVRNRNRDLLLWLVREMQVPLPRSLVPVLLNQLPPDAQQRLRESINAVRGGAAVGAAGPPLPLQNPNLNRLESGPA